MLAFPTQTLTMAYMKLNFEGKSVEDLIRVRENLSLQVGNEYALRIIVLIDFRLRQMAEGSETEEETESEATESEEEETESECEDRPLCRNCEIETRKHCDECGGYGSHSEDESEEESEEE